MSHPVSRERFDKNMHIFRDSYAYIWISACIYIICVYLHNMLIYIYIYILTYYLPAFTVTRKKEKKTPRTRDNNISNYRPGEKRKNIIGQKKKKRPTSSHQLKKSRDMQSVGQKKKKTTVKCCKSQLQKLNRESGLS